VRRTSEQALGEVDRRGLASEAGARLHRATSRGILKLGQKIDEETVARELHLSRSPLREALVELTAQGLLVFKRVLNEHGEAVEGPDTVIY